MKIWRYRSHWIRLNILFSQVDFEFFVCDRSISIDFTTRKTLVLNEKGWFRFLKRSTRYSRRRERTIRYESDLCRHHGQCVCVIKQRRNATERNKRENAKPAKSPSVSINIFFFRIRWEQSWTIASRWVSTHTERARKRWRSWTRKSMNSLVAPIHRVRTLISETSRFRHRVRHRHRSSTIWQAVQAR